MGVKNDLRIIVGAEGICDDPEILGTYSCDQSFVPPSLPEVVVFPQHVEQIKEIIKVANYTTTPVVPFSSGLNLHGAAIPSRGGIILNLSKMNKVIEINEVEWFTTIEPGVTYGQLQDILQPKGLRLMVPWGIPPARTVLSSYLERDPLLAAASFEYGNHLLMDMEIVLPQGELFRTGCWNLGGRPGGYFGPGVNMPFRLWTAAQGTLGVITKLVINVQHLSPVRKFFFLSFNTLQEAIEPLRVIQRKEIGWECIGLNTFNLAALLTREWTIPDSFPATPHLSSEFEQHRKALPPWVIVIGITGLPYFPEEKVRYEEETLHEICHSMNCKLQEFLPEYPELNQTFLEESLRPWGILKKFRYRGSVHDISFKTPLSRLPNMEKTVSELASSAGYPAEDIGGYFIIMERGRAAHVEFDFHCDPSHKQNKTQVASLWEKMSAQLLENGALYDRPYGIWADLIYRKAPHYHTKLFQLKQQLDPHNIMNPGKLSL